MNEEDFNTLKGLKLHVRKNIRKLKSTRKQSACSSHTLPDTLTKSIHNKNLTPINSPSMVPMEPYQKPILISPLKTLLSKSSGENSRKEFIELPLCGPIQLKNRKTRKLEKFKLFEEKEFPLFSQSITQVSLNEPGYDNDDDTDNEQIRNGIKVMEDSIVEALRDYKERVINISKYEL